MGIRYEDVTLRYRKGPNVLSKVSFYLRPRAFYFLAGASGAGKTSLLRLLSMSLRPCSGKITMFEQDTAKLPCHGLPALRQRIGMIFQDFRLLPHLNLLDNVILPLRVTGMEREEAIGYGRELLSWVGIHERQMYECPHSISGGQQQRVAIARAVINKPDLILADEPTGNLDPELSMKCLHLLETLYQDGATVVFATHDQQLLRNSQHPILRLHGGRLQVQGSY
jgi:cell division transport system ATP-binding protein